MLGLNFSICEASDCTSLTFADTTGIYDAVTNTTGWGTPNEDISDVTTPVTLSITTPLNTKAIDLTATSPAFPVEEAPNSLVITPEDLDLLTTKLPDGKYTFVYTVTTSERTYTQTAVIGIYCQVQCCVFSMFKGLKGGCGSCDKTAKLRAEDAYIMLQGLKMSLNEGDVSNFEATLAELQKICANQNCSNC